jgi:plastocyanin
VIRVAGRLLAMLLSTACVDIGGTPPDAGPLPDAEGPIEGDGGLVVDVAMAGMAFRPARIQIPRGATVRWTNYDAVPHTATQGKPNVPGTPYFASPLLDAGDTFEFRFDEPGEWLYYCLTHPFVMKDAVVQVM